MISSFDKNPELTKQLKEEMLRYENELETQKEAENIRRLLGIGLYNKYDAKKQAGKAGDVISNKLMDVVNAHKFK